MQDCLYFTRRVLQVMQHALVFLAQMFYNSSMFVNNLYFMGKESLLGSGSFVV